MRDKTKELQNLIMTSTKHLGYGAIVLPGPRIQWHGKDVRSLHLNDTWIEGEEFAYPRGGFTRRAYVEFPDKVKRVVRCSLPDSAISIPARAQVKHVMVRGYIMQEDFRFKFFPDKYEEVLFGIT